jgi:hypothetical protein
LDIIDLVLGRKAMCEEVYEDITNETNIWIPVRQQPHHRALHWRERQSC